MHRTPSRAAHAAASQAATQLTVCPFTDRTGMYTAVRGDRPRPAPVRHPLPDEVATCPFCPLPDTDPRRLPVEAEVGGRRWVGLINLFPPLDGATGTSHLAVSTHHALCLTHPHPDLQADWHAMFATQQALVAGQPERWSMLTVAVGRSAGASQHHPHGHVLTPAFTPPEAAARAGRLEDPAVLASVLADTATVAADGQVRLVVAPVPLGGFDLLAVPEQRGPLPGLDPAVLARLVVRWIAAVHTLTGPGPFDAKVTVHDALPDRPGRWWAELGVTARHAPGVSMMPLVELAWPRHLHAEAFRAAVAGQPAGR